MASFSRRTFVAGAVTTVVAACSSKRSTTAAGPPPNPAPPAPTITAVPSGPARAIYNGPRDRPTVALTFHGSGDLSLAERLLAEAARVRAPITVFAVGQWLDQQPGMARRILDAGHELANHTYTHPDMAGMSETRVAAELARCRDVLTRQMGGTGVYARPSGLDRYSAPVLAAAGDAGYATVAGFDVDSLDYQDPGAAAVRSNVAKGVKGGSIVSLHFGHAGTVEAFAPIVADLRAKGLAPVLLRDMLK